MRLTDHPDLVKAKLIEEAFELFWEQETKGLLRELADIVEVVLTISRLIGVDFGAVIAEAQRRREERGGFDGGTILLETGPQVATPKVKHPTLFDDSDDREEPESPDELRVNRPAPDQPRGTRAGLVIPAIPPDSDHPQRAYPVRSGDGKIDVVVTYSGRNIVIRPSLYSLRAGEKPAPKKGGDQGGLFDGDTPDA